MPPRVWKALQEAQAQDHGARSQARDLIPRRFGPSEEMDRRYVGDIIYIATWEGWSYLATGGRSAP